MIDISEINKVNLLKQLWKNQKSAACFRTFNEEDAEKAVERYIDYYDGRSIKTDLSKNEVDPYLYDRGAGQGTFKKVVNSLK